MRKRSTAFWRDRFAVFAISGFVALEALADPLSAAGRVCLAPIPEASTERELPDVQYAVAIDGREAIALSSSRVGWVTGLSSKDRHSVVIFANEVRRESFTFAFAPGEHALCLFMSSLYETWQLWPVERTGVWCPCVASDPERLRVSQRGSNSAS